VHRYRYRARKQAADSPVGRLLTRAVAVSILRGSILELLLGRFAPNSRRFMPKARRATCWSSRLHCIVFGEMGSKRRREAGEGHGVLRRGIVVVVVPPVEELDLVGPVQVLSAANRLSGKKVYSIEIVTNAKGLTVEGEGGILSFLAQGRLQG